MRARLALTACNLQCELIEIKLASKPKQMLALSPKGTVPVLHFKESGKVLEESLDIMVWALGQNPEQNWLPHNKLKQNEIFKMIELNDHHFKPWLDKYKYASRFPEQSPEYYFQQASVYLKQLESSLHASKCLGGEGYNLADMAILPFIRQFAFVNRELFYQAFPTLARWLDDFLACELFKKVMVKYPVWQEGQQKVYFPA